MSGKRVRIRPSGLVILGKSIIGAHRRAVTTWGRGERVSVYSSEPDEQAHTFLLIALLYIALLRTGRTRRSVAVGLPL